MIELKNVCFQYRGSKQGCLDNISMTIADGETVVLSGGSGCGKTTVTRLINGLIPHYYNGELSGEIFVNGKAPADRELYALSGTVGSVFQNPRSQFFTVKTDAEIVFGCENIGISPEEILKRKDAVVKEMQLESLLGRSLFELSGGEKQKIACASVSALMPQIIVLDEPTSNLDFEAIEKLKVVLVEWKRQGKTIIIAEHRLHFLRELADKLIILENGRITREFSSEEIKKLSAAETEKLGIRPISLAGVGFLKSASHTSSESIKFENFIFRYKNGEHGIDILDLEVPKNAVIAVIGHNGAGKSTFVRCLCGLENKCKGTVIMDGKTLKTKQRLHECYMIMQDVNHQLFTESVTDEVKLSITDKTISDGEKNKIALEILSQLDLREQSELHPMALSGGQKQRVAIASGIASNKELLIFDEPTSGLDLSHMKQVAYELRQLKAAGKTVFVVTHDPEFIAGCCEYVIHLQSGSVKDSYYLDDEGIGKIRDFFWMVETM